MQRPGWNPQRRNNEMKIPDTSRDSYLFYERLVNPVIVNRMVHNHEITFIVEPVQMEFLHACTLDDIIHVLSLLPIEHSTLINLVVLRQPKSKEKLLKPVWGRLQYWSTILKYSGVAIHLESQSKNQVLRWDKSLSPDDTQELNRLIEDGHKLVTQRRYHLIHTSLESNRNIQLYRTLPHEIGHYVDYLESVIIPAGEDLDENMRLRNLYCTKTSHDKEAFAHRYANNFIKSQHEKGKIPFNRIMNEEKLISEGLKPEWFLDKV